MIFSQYFDFGDFCIKNNCTPVQGLRILDKELKQRSETKT